ncbi:MAG: HAMP domain-containing histidine kinase [Deltaproteobacteria bacterium]|nr:HAMP domain-containing histidine kinase [Deltaproteobacteria bacterium]
MTSDGNDYNIRILQGLADFLREYNGAPVLERVAISAGLQASDFDGKSRWVSLGTCERFLSSARELFPDDEAFREANAQKYRTSYGPLMATARVTTPWSGYLIGAKIVNSVLCRAGHFEPHREGSRCTMSYISRNNESHLMCLTRRMQIAMVPTIWGLPPVSVEHPRCIALGDDRCEYVFTLVEPVRWLLSALGAAAGLAATAMFNLAGITTVSTAWALPLLGLLGGLALEWRRASRANGGAVRDIQDAMLRLAREDAETRREILEFQRREREWTRLMEEQIAERLASQQRVIEQIRALETQRLKAMQGLSHDLRSPLTVMRLSTDVLKCDPRADQEMLSTLARASAQLTTLVGNLMETVTSPGTAPNLTPSTVAVPKLVETIRRRLNALCYHRDIRTSTFSTREAPEQVEIDEVLLDRVIDNLLTNAVKYTERGSILVEIGGTPGMLTLKVSDTGRGIEDRVLERIFQPGGSEKASRVGDSYGLGLSVVVQRLDRIGGKLEVMSKPNVGTTFWAHLPARPVLEAARHGDRPPATDAPTDAVCRVVVIRRDVSGT